MVFAFNHWNQLGLLMQKEVTFQFCPNNGMEPRELVHNWFVR